MFGIHKHNFNQPHTVRFYDGSYLHGTYILVGCDKCPRRKEIFLSHSTLSMDAVEAYVLKTYNLRVVFTNKRPI